jgi:hypothetical protein
VLGRLKAQLVYGNVQQVYRRMIEWEDGDVDADAVGWRETSRPLL